MENWSKTKAPIEWLLAPGDPRVPMKRPPLRAMTSVSDTGRATSAVKRLAVVAESPAAPSSPETEHRGMAQRSPLTGGIATNNGTDGPSATLGRFGSGPRVPQGDHGRDNLERTGRCERHQQALRPLPDHLKTLLYRLSHVPGEPEPTEKVDNGKL
jgi:hypothetical protein